MLYNGICFVVVAAAFGVSQAMTNSGVAEGLAKFLVRVGNGLNIGGKSRPFVVAGSHIFK